MPQVDAMVRAIAGPETLSNGGSKWSIVLDNGAMLVTFSDGCQKALGNNLDVNLTFTTEEPSNPGMAPKITKVMKGSELIWEPAARRDGQGGRSYDPSTEFAKHAVGTAGAIVGNVILAHAKAEQKLPDVKELILEAMTEWAPLLHDELLTLKAQATSAGSVGGGPSS